MMMSDREIQDALKNREIEIGNYSPDCLEPASYDMRLGNRILISRQEKEINIGRQNGEGTINPGDFALLTTYENIKLSKTIAGSIGLRSYYARKGLILLAGPQIDPGFKGVLVLGVYNASPRKITLSYLDKLCTIGFHKLGKPTEKSHSGIEEQRQGRIPTSDKDYLRMLETKNLSELSESTAQLFDSVSRLKATTNRIIIPLLIALFGIVVAIISVVIAVVTIVIR